MKKTKVVVTDNYSSERQRSELSSAPFFLLECDAESNITCSIVRLIRLRCGIRLFPVIWDGDFVSTWGGVIWLRFWLFLRWEGGIEKHENEPSADFPFSP